MIGSVTVHVRGSAVAVVDRRRPSEEPRLRFYGEAPSFTADDFDTFVDDVSAAFDALRKRAA